ncbi:MAG: cytochrome c3 family protein [Thermoanaerobaculum sp.]
MIPRGYNLWVGLCGALLVWTLPASGEECLACHGRAEDIKAAAEALGVSATTSRLSALVVRVKDGSVHAGLACSDCHPRAVKVPHPEDMSRDNPCVGCHEDAAAEVGRSIHRDPLGATSFRVPCWGCHTAHDVRPASDPDSSLAPVNVARVCLSCHNKQEYLVGVHGYGVQKAGLDMAATCVSCHGGHEILPASEPASRVNRVNVPKTCGTCHRRVTEVFLASVHGQNLGAENRDVPTCTDCHAAHGTLDPRLPRFRNASPEMCARCHADPEVVGKYGLRAEVFDTYVADFHGTTAVLFLATTPDQPLNKAVCYDCHGYHDVESVRRLGTEKVQERLLARCQACHPQASTRFLSAWTAHYVPDKDRYPVIYYVRLFYQVVIPTTIGFFLAYIALDVWGRRRQRRLS